MTLGTGERHIALALGPTDDENSGSVLCVGDGGLWLPAVESKYTKNNTLIQLHSSFIRFLNLVVFILLTYDERNLHKMPSGRWYDAEAGENILPSPDETDVAGGLRVLLATSVVSPSLSLARSAGCRYGLHDSERTDGACDRVSLR